MKVSLYMGALAALSARCAQFSAFSRKSSDCFMVSFLSLEGDVGSGSAITTKFQ